MTVIIDKNNYEQWLVRYSDGSLTAAEREAVEQWLETHPDAAAEMALYHDAPCLDKNESEHYTGPIPGTSRPLWPAIIRWSAVAAVLVVLILPFAFHQDDAVMPIEVAEVRQTPIVHDDLAKTQMQVEPIVAQEPYIAPQDGILNVLDNIYAEKPQPIAQRVKYVDNLIAFEQDVPEQTYDTNLIVCDSGVVREPELKDFLLAFNDAYAERSYLGHFIGTIIKTNQ